MKEQKQEQEKKNIEQSEVCVLCGDTVAYRAEQPLSGRQYYFEVAGQLCPTCYKKVYGDLK